MEGAADGWGARLRQIKALRQERFRKEKAAACAGSGRRATRARGSERQRSRGSRGAQAARRGGGNLECRVNENWLGGGAF